MKFTFNPTGNYPVRSSLKPLTIFKYCHNNGPIPKIAMESVNHGGHMDFDPSTGNCGDVHGQWVTMPVEILGTLKFEL